ncbi:MAG: tetratricopeptide repeat protein [Synergistaceae bacterium]|jgi:tetratricopeptide (TPR) repeat protein|nr:tetratricopeptide repeat protein [Synergistaceae bacterium]
MFTVKAVEMKKGKIKKSFAALILSLLCLCYFVLVPVGPAGADRYSPPDESIPERPAASDDARVRQEKNEAARRARERAAAAKRRAREKAEREAKAAADAARAAAERAAEEERRRAASEDMINRVIMNGRSLVENGRFQSAINVLGGFLDANPHSADGWYWISRAHHALGDYDRAQLAANITLEIDPYYPELVKTPSGLEPRPYLTKQQRKEPRPSMSVLPVKPPLPSNLLLAPVVISFPILVDSESPQQTYPESSARGAHSEELASSMTEPEGSDSVTGAYLRYVPYPPEPLGATVAWMQSEHFNEISRWRFRVDRMGILMEPRVPIAWKGSHPYEVYFWTGREWARVRRKGGRYDSRETYDDILYSAQDNIAEVLSDRGFVWNEPDVPSLAASASLMRYMWMGNVDLAEARRRAEKKARERALFNLVSDDVKSDEVKPTAQ